MGFRFRKSIKIAPDLKLNFNKKSMGITFGKKGANYTVNSNGKRTASVGIPETGLSYSKTINSKASKKRSVQKNDLIENGGSESMKTKTSKKGCLPAIIIGVVLACIIGACGGGGDDVAETTTEIADVIKSVITTEHTTLPTTLITETTTVKETTEPTTTQKETTTEKKTTTTQKETTTEKKTTTTKKETTTEKKTTTTKKATTTKATTTKAPTTTKKVTTTKKPTTQKSTTKKVTAAYNGSETGEMVWIPESGKKYHNDPSCSNMNNPSKVSVGKAEKMGYTPCKKCY